MPLAGCELTIPVFERAEAFHALDREATVTDILHNYRLLFITTNHFVSPQHIHARYLNAMHLNVRKGKAKRIQTYSILL
jgi:hypothetical protein